MTDTSREALIKRLRRKADAWDFLNPESRPNTCRDAADMLEADGKAQQVAAPYDQQALELCPECGWKAIMPGEPCFICNLKTEAQQVAVPVAVLDAISRAGYMLVKTQSGYTLIPTSRIEAQGVKP